jgi:hypothetical protein
MAEFSAKANCALQNIKKTKAEIIAFLKTSPRVPPEIITQ